VEQLHAHDSYQNVTEHKTSGHNINYETKSIDMHNTESGAGMVKQVCHARYVWLLHAHGSSTPCAL